jgi:hypothetical protein
MPKLCYNKECKFNLKEHEHNKYIENNCFIKLTEDDMNECEDYKEDEEKEDDESN